jgi:hypothetical protein
MMGKDGKSVHFATISAAQTAAVHMHSDRDCCFRRMSPGEDPGAKSFHFNKNTIPGKFEDIPTVSSNLIDD